MFPEDNEDKKEFDLPPDRLFAKLAGQREELDLLRRELRMQSPSMLSVFLALQVALILFIGALVVVLAPYFQLAIPPQLSVVAAFAAVPLAFMAYLAHRKYATEVERYRLHRRASARAHLVIERADALIRALPTLSRQEYSFPRSLEASPSSGSHSPAADPSSNSTKA